MNNFTQNYPYRRKLIFIKQFIPQNIKLDPLILILFNLYNFSKHMILLCVIILFYHLMSTFLFLSTTSDCVLRTARHICTEPPRLSTTCKSLDN
jgi:hypothetical protein